MSHLGNENYSEQGKLALNIYDDFEKQESWQSYTTLLFADLGNETKEGVEKQDKINKILGQLVYKL